MGVKVKRCVIISGAPENDTAYYSEYINSDYIICADSGYVKCVESGINPDIIIGDFDSAAIPDIDCEIITLNPIKDDTDTLHCVKTAIERGYNDIIILGALGGRADHTYSNILVLNYCCDSGIKCSLIDSKNRLRVFNSSVKIKKDKYKYFSFFPLFEKCEGVSFYGAEYCVNNKDIYPYNMYTQSNSFIDDVSITLKRGKFLLVESND